VFNTVNVVTLATMLLVSIIACACQVNLEFEADEKCWETFKRNNCDINAPKGI
jgi:hypothetical protein